MTVEEQIKKHISSQPEPKRSDLQALHERTLRGRQEVNYGSTMEKTPKNNCTNPTIWYGL